jgi:hypothetical protein
MPIAHFQMLTSTTWQMGAEGSPSDQLAATDLLWKDSHRVSPDQQCQLCANRAANKVLTILYNSGQQVIDLQTFRLAHRLRDMQTLPYVVLRNQHLNHVYELYYKAFDRFRKLHEVYTLDDNDRFCKIVKETLTDHLVGCALSNPICAVLTLTIDGDTTTGNGCA